MITSTEINERQLLCYVKYETEHSMDSSKVIQKDLEAADKEITCCVRKHNMMIQDTGPYRPTLTHLGKTRQVCDKTLACTKLEYTFSRYELTLASQLHVFGFR